MPRQLPGLRWDHARQRYFPLQTRSVSTPGVQVDPVPDAVAIHHRRSPPHRALANIRSTFRTVHKDALIHQIRSSQLPLTDRVILSSTPLEGHFSAFQTVCHHGRVWNFAGDTVGWFYSSDEETDGWQRRFCLSSEVTFVGVSDTTCVATSFGPECRILYVPLEPASEEQHSTYTSRIDSHVVHDIWTADLQASRLVLGANKQAVVIADIAVGAPLKRLPTKSDVLALAQTENLLYTGLRNGGILRFDTRLGGSSIYPLFESGSQRASSITGLKHLRDHQLLASFIDGRISTFDLRFPVQKPVLTFTGNVNSYTTRLPLATDPNENFLFAAGQDNRLRFWSLVTGGAALDPGGLVDPALIRRPFEHRVAALQVVEEREGMCLWAASGRELCKYSLGHRAEIQGHDT